MRSGECCGFFPVVTVTSRPSPALSTISYVVTTHPVPVQRCLLYRRDYHIPSQSSAVYIVVTSVAQNAQSPSPIPG